MLSGTFASLAGCTLLYLLPTLPPLWVLVSIVAAAVPFWRHRKLRWIAWLLFYVAWSGFHATHARQFQLPATLDGAELQVTGTIIGLVEHDRARYRFLIETEPMDQHGDSGRWAGTVRLSWYTDEPLTLVPGERWKLAVRLFAPRGYANPGGFDYERWLYAQGIEATGSVRTGRRMAAAVGLNRWVDRVRTRYQVALARGGEQHGLVREGVLAALAIGDRSAITDIEWRRFLDTGTNHLMAISGLHIGYAATLGYLLGYLIWWCTPLRRRLPKQVVGAVVATVMALLYSGLAGFSLPTQRALVMLVVVCGAVIARRPAWSWRTLGVACQAVLLATPTAVLEPGFWLSFGAVGAIVYVINAWPAGTLRQVVTLQGWLFLALAPLVLWGFGRISLVAPIANLLAIPWLSFTVVPPLLAALLLFPVSENLGGAALAVADFSLDWLMELLGLLADLPFAVWEHHSPTLWAVGMALVAFLWLASGHGMPMRAGALILLLPLGLLAPSGLPQGQAVLHVLDVGQGLAVVVQTHRHALLFDAGPRNRGGFDAGEAIVRPFLREAGISRLDLAIISHADSDHSGGWESLSRALRVGDIITGDPTMAAVDGVEACLAGQEWRLDGVVISVLAPVRPTEGNEGSCVVRIATGRVSALLTADIGQPEEAVLVRRMRQGLRSDVLIAPHHGSRSSSSPGFVTAVAPKHVVYSMRHHNRYGHPHQEVVGRYRAIGAREWSTAGGGLLSFELHPQGNITAHTYRNKLNGFWRSASWYADVDGLEDRVKAPH